MEKFEKDTLRGMLVKGNLRAAMAYWEQFPETAALYEKGVALFQKEHYLTYDADAELNGILLVYQKYYRDVFYLELSAGGDAFRQKSFHALMGRTSGYYGPYIWKDEELRRYKVELPEGTQDYAVKFLDGFLMKSWLDYISFGETGTGGWSNGDGLIHCVRTAYDLESENFQVSLLKHEAQHAMDHARYKGITSEELEYRAKLVELIYSRERRMLERFLGQADTTRADNGHGLSAERIVREFEIRQKRDRGRLAELPVETVQTAAQSLFAESCQEMAAKYRQS